MAKMFGRSLSIQAIIAIAGIWSALPVEGFQCVRAHKAEWANDIEIWGFNCPWRKGVEDRCYFLNCSDGHQIRSEWGCVSDFDDGDLSNCESYPNYFEDNGFKCACQIGEKDKDMSNRDMAIPFTTTTTTTTATPHLCIQATIEGPESTENKTLSEEQCKAGEMLCFFYNCTLGTDPNKRIAEWGCSNETSFEICAQKYDAFDYKPENDDDDLCTCLIGPTNKRLNLMTKVEVEELPRNDKPFSFATRSIGHFKPILMTFPLILGASLILALKILCFSNCERHFC